ncbi:MAG: phosphodiester glycosidase family protein [Anaerolineae bacterium]
MSISNLRSIFQNWQARFLGLLLLGGCIQPVAVPTSDSTATPTVASPAAGWEILVPGLERRNYHPDPNNPITRMVALRIDPTLYTFRVHYHPGQFQSTQQSMLELGEAVAFINANYFFADGTILGMLVTDGITYGTSYTDRGGMFYVEAGQPFIRSLLRQPFLNEALEQAVQAFPMLVLDGVQAFSDDIRDRPTRRTIIGQDASGRIIILATPLLGLPLRDLSAYLPTTDMNIVTAFNLDGGGSTMMALNLNNSPEYVVSSFDAVPAVLAVYSK